jgi:hypothetical protein
MIGDGDCGEIGGINIGRGIRSTQRKPAPAPFCPPQIPLVSILFSEVFGVRKVHVIHYVKGKFLLLNSMYLFKNAH